MNRTPQYARWILPCLFLCFLAPAAFAQRERILDYRSDIEVRADASMLVTETIRVQSAGQAIRHGIYRDFPTRYTDRLGNRYVVGFQMLSATRDRKPETFRVEDYSNGKRVFFGRSDFILPAGLHVYTLTYTTDRQIGFFSDRDELFWNVTGNGWIFPIDHASANVRLPANIPPDAVRVTGYTGPPGSTARDLTAALGEHGGFDFAVTHPLAAREGLTILLSWPKGYIVEPNLNRKLNYFFEDNRDVLIASAALVIVFIYYLLVWTAVGRDPGPGAIVTLYDPPNGFSPAATRYLLHMGYDNKAFASAVLDMAVKGFLQIKEQAGSYTLYRTKADSRILSPEEKAVAEKLFADGRTEIWLHNENHVQISGAMSALKTALKAAEQKVYFVTNSGYMAPAVLFSLAAIVAMIYMQGGPKASVAAFLCVWLTIWSIAVAAMVIQVVHLWQLVGASGSQKAGALRQAITLSILSMFFLGGEAMGLTMLVMATSFTVVAALLATIFLHMLFHYLLKAPTRAGRSVLDKIEGFKMFLGKVDGDRMNRVMPPDQTPQTFEKFLPYALAMDVEQAWAEKFSGVLNGASGALSSNANGYSPAWYSGSSWNGLGAAAFAGSFSSSFTSAISSSASAPGSSGGGSGGSGGGGGGGGGGGW